MSTNPAGDVRSFSGFDSPREQHSFLLNDFHVLSGQNPADVAKQIKEFQNGDKDDVPSGFPGANQIAIAGIDVHNPRNESRTARTIDMAGGRAATLDRGISFDTNRSDVMVRFDRSAHHEQRADASRRNGDEWRNGRVSLTSDEHDLHLGEGKSQPEIRRDGRHDDADCKDGRKGQDDKNNGRNDDPNCKDGDKKHDGKEEKKENDERKNDDPNCKDGEKKNDKNDPKCEKPEPKPEPPHCEPKPEPPTCGERDHHDRRFEPPFMFRIQLPEPAWLTNPYRGDDRNNDSRSSFPFLPFMPSDIPGAFAEPFGDRQNGLLPSPADLIDGLQNIFGGDRSHQQEPRLATPNEFVRDLGDLLFGNCNGGLPSPTELISGLQKAIVKGDNDSALPTPPSPENFMRGLQQLLGTNSGSNQFERSIPSPEQFTRGLSNLLNLDGRPLGDGTAHRHLCPRDAMNGGGDYVPRCGNSFDPGNRGPLPNLPGIGDIPMPRLPGLPNLGDLPRLPGLPGLPGLSDLIGSLPPLPVPGKFPLPTDLLPGLPLPSLPGLPELPLPKSPLAFLNPTNSKKGGFLSSLLPF